jgi:diguanylate cyclase (GGDEF)-like protein
MNIHKEQPNKYQTGNKSVTNSHYETRFNLVGNRIYVFSLIGHLWFIILFLILNIPELAGYNVLSCVIFYTCLKLHSKKNYVGAFLLGALEVVVHSLICALLIGWNTGFHYFIVAVIPFGIVLPVLSLAKKLVIGIVLMSIYGVAYFATASFPTIHSLNPAIITILSFTNIAITFGAFTFLIHYFSEASKKAEIEIWELSRTDYLTGLFNRRGVIEHLEALWAEYVRYQRPFALVIGDIDNFKLVNDTLGHTTGDEVLKYCSYLLVKQLRKSDIVARWGGEEFLILLPDTDQTGLEKAGQKIIDTFRMEQFSYQGIVLDIRITLGGTWCCYQSKPTGISELIHKADGGLYRGKDQGKNQFVLVE